MWASHSNHQSLELEMKSLYPRLCGNQIETNPGVRETECQPWDLKMGILYVDRTNGMDHITGKFVWPLVTQKEQISWKTIFLGNSK